MLIQVIIRLKWQLRTRRRQPSSPPLEPSATFLYPLGSRVVGGNCPPRAPMGPEPLRLSGERAEGAQRADWGEHTGGLPRFGPRWTRKTLLLLGLYSTGELGSLKS